MYELFFVGLMLLGFIYYLYNDDESTNDDEPNIDVEEYISKFRNYVNIVHILNNGDENQILSLFKLLYNKHEYSTIVDIINKREYLLSKPQIEKIYEDALYQINNNDEECKVL